MSSNDIDINPASVKILEGNTTVDLANNDNQTEKSEAKSETSKDGGWGWVVVIASFISHLISDGIIYAYGVLATEFIAHFGITRSTVGWLGSALVAVTFLIGPLAGYLCRRFSYRSVAVTGSIISVIGFGTPYFYPKLWFLIVSSSILCGIGFGLIYVPSILIINMWFEKKRSFAIGIAVCGSGIGTFVFSFLFQLLLKKFGWKETMLISAGILLLLIPCSLTYSEVDENKRKIVPNKAETSEKTEYVVEMELLSQNNVKKNIEENLTGISENDNTNTELECNVNKSSSIFAYVEMMKNPIFILYLISAITSSIGFNAPYMFAKDRAIQFGISADDGSWLISYIGIGNCLGRVGFGFLATLKGVDRFHLYNITRTISGLILVASWYAINYGLMITYTIIYGMMTGAFVTLTSVILGDIFGLDKLNVTFGLSLFFQGLSVLVGPPLAGFIYDTTLSYDISFAVCGIFITFSGLIMYLAYGSGSFRRKIFVL